MFVDTRMRRPGLLSQAMPQNAQMQGGGLGSQMGAGYGSSGLAKQPVMDQQGGMDMQKMQAMNQQRVPYTPTPEEAEKQRQMSELGAMNQQVNNRINGLDRQGQVDQQRMLALDMQGGMDRMKNAPNMPAQGVDLAQMGQMDRQRGMAPQMNPNLNSMASGRRMAVAPPRPPQPRTFEQDFNAFAQKPSQPRRW